MQKVNKVIADKLYRLSSFLLNACKEFEHVAKQISDKNIKMSVRSVALETKQYMEELNSQLKTLRVKNTINRIDNNEEIKSRYVRNKNNIPAKKVIQLCCNSEVYFLKAYRSILNEYLPYKGLKDMLRYQLNGIKSAFEQLKLLNSVMAPEAKFSTVLY